MKTSREATGRTEEKTKRLGLDRPQAEETRHGYIVKRAIEWKQQGKRKRGRRQQTCRCIRSKVGGETLSFEGSEMHCSK